MARLEGGEKNDGRVCSWEDDRGKAEEQGGIVGFLQLILFPPYQDNDTNPRGMMHCTLN